MTESDGAARLRTRLQRVQTQIHAFRELHSQELDLILDELTDIAASAGEVGAAAKASAPADAAPEPRPDPADPAAASPKRARWLAEQDRRSRMSRRDLLRGREEP